MFADHTKFLGIHNDQLVVMFLDQPFFLELCDDTCNALNRHTGEFSDILSIEMQWKTRRFVYSFGKTKNYVCQPAKSLFFGETEKPSTGDHMLFSK